MDLTREKWCCAGGRLSRLGEHMSDEYKKTVYYCSVAVVHILSLHDDSDTKVGHIRTDGKGGRQVDEHWFPEYASHNETTETYPSILLVTTVC